ncbi:MAG: VWA domain-containing protein [Acidobacteria bacterium]|nr:VWA domain-containing protein [Acidobacteriota bacterium]
MKRYDLTSSLLSLLLVFAQFAPVAGQGVGQDKAARPASTPPSTTPARTPSQQATPTLTPTPQPAASEADDDVVRITSNLVQLDAVVTDKQGRQVTDLRPEDFEVLVDGKPQPITNFSYVSNETRTITTQPIATSPVDKNAPPVPPARLRPEQVRRTIALVVDDLGTSFESVHFVRQSLKKFVDEQMQPSDLVAIMRTSAGMGALQQFTSDKRLLYAAIERVRWYPAGRAGVSAFAPIESDPRSEFNQQRDQITPPSSARSGDESRDTEGAPGGLDEFREEIFSVGTLGALNFIIRGLKELPGRKSVVMFSDGFHLFDKENRNVRVFEAVRRLTDLANRASVVIYTIDARGLPTLGLTAADSTSGMRPDQVASKLDERRTAHFDSQDGMHYLAQETGGFFIRNTNDIGVARILDDQKGYYLIGYRPDEATFKAVGGRVHFNKFQLKVKRPGLSVRTRNGFYGVTDEDIRPPAHHTRYEQMLVALSSPFASGDLRLRLTSLFTNEAEKASYVSSLMHIDMSKITFTDEPDGWHKAVMDVIALTFGENGNVVDQINRTENIRARGETFNRLVRDGLVYMMRVPVKKAGAYQLRVAVRDAATEKLGTASQFIEVPDLKKDRLALSGIVMRGAVRENAAGKSPATPQQSGTGEGQSSDLDPMSTPAVRRFHQSSDVDYFFSIYNAKLDRATNRPQLQTQLRLFRDGQPVFSGKLLPFDPKEQPDLKRLLSGSRLHLGKELPPGEYVLQVVVHDLLAQEKRRIATQWIDFEVVK